MTKSSHTWFDRQPAVFCLSMHVLVCIWLAYLSELLEDLSYSPVTNYMPENLVIWLICIPDETNDWGIMWLTKTSDWLHACLPGSFIGMAL